MEGGGAEVTREGWWGFACGVCLIGVVAACGVLLLPSWHSCVYRRNLEEIVRQLNEIERRQAETLRLHPEFKIVSNAQTGGTVAEGLSIHSCGVTLTSGTWGEVK